MFTYLITIKDDAGNVLVKRDQRAASMALALAVSAQILAGEAEREGLAVSASIERYEGTPA